MAQDSRLHAVALTAAAGEDASAPQSVSSRPSHGPVPRTVRSAGGDDGDVLSDIASSADGAAVDPATVGRLASLRTRTRRPPQSLPTQQQDERRDRDEDDDQDEVAEDSASTSSPLSKSSRAANRLLKTRRDRRNRLKGSTDHVDDCHNNNSSNNSSDNSNNSSSDNSNTSNNSASPTPEASDRATDGQLGNRDAEPPTSPPSNTVRSDAEHAVAAVPETPASNGQGASQLAIRSLRRLREARARTPGGAAAKLVGRIDTDAPTDTNPSVDDEPPVVEAPVTELDAIRQKAKDEFSSGTATNRRYHQILNEYKSDEPDANEQAVSEASLPSILNRSEVFHKNATAAVLSLLSSRSRAAAGTADSRCSATSPSRAPTLPASNLHIHRTESHATAHSGKTADSHTHSVFQPPKRSDQDDDDDEVFSIRSGALSITAPTLPPRHNEHASARGPIEKPLISTATEKRVEAMARRMKDPSKTLADLLAAIASPGDESLGRGYMVRRKNACGALKVLTTKMSKRVTICWTVGVLPALTSVLQDDRRVPQSDHATRNEYIEARKRAISSLLNLVAPVENRLALFHSPGLVPALVQTIEHDDQEACRGCCAILAYLAKTADNRLLMVQVPGLVEAVTSVIQPPKRDVVIVSRDMAPRMRDMDTDMEGLGDSTWSEDDVSQSDAPNPQEDQEEYTDVETDGMETGGETTLDGDVDDQNPVEDDDDDDDDHSSTHSMSSTYAESSKSSDSGDDKFFGSSAQEDDDDGGDNEEGDVVEESIDEMVRRYDDDPNIFLHGARQNVFALLGHLVKEKDNAYHLVRSLCLVEALVTISRLHGSGAHVHAVRLLAHLTRHRSNSKEIVFTLKTVVPVLVNATYSNSEDCRRYACFALQNVTQDKPCRQELAVIPNLLTALCVRARQSQDVEERLAAIHALKNLTDEPANLIPMTNTPECFATLMQIAHASDDSITEKMQYLGCDALATLSHWFRSIATSGQRIEAIKAKKAPSKELFVPTLKIVTYEQWT